MDVPIFHPGLAKYDASALELYVPGPGEFMFEVRGAPNFLPRDLPCDSVPTNVLD